MARAIASKKLNSAANGKVRSKDYRTLTSRTLGDIVTTRRHTFTPTSAALLHRRLHIDETLSYHDFPREHHRHIYTNNPLEAIMRQIRRRTRVVGAFPDGKSAVMLSAARLRHIAGTQWGTKRYMNMDRLRELKQERLAELEGVA